MTAVVRAPGLQADWINAWLAAIGCCVLVPDLRLRWSRDAVPIATFSGVDDVATAVADAMPSVEDLDELAIARSVPGRREFPRKATVADLRDRAPMEYAAQWASLAATVTDLVELSGADELAHSPFDPPVPRGITLFERLKTCREAFEGSEAIRATLNGVGARVDVNGLGFDPRRIPTGVDATGVRVDPVVETLAFFGIGLFPCRGDGRSLRAVVRGWTGSASRQGSFTWPTWRAPLDVWAIDAILDRFHGGRPVVGGPVFSVAPYRARGSADTTRAYAAVRRG